MDSKRNSRRELLKAGAALAGGITLGTSGKAAQAQGHEPSDDPRQRERLSDDSRQQGADRIRPAFQIRDLGARTAPHRRQAVTRRVGKVFHVATPLQDSVGVITPSSLHYIATTRGSFLPDIDPSSTRSRYTAWWIGP